MGTSYSEKATGGAAAFPKDIDVGSASVIDPASGDKAGSTVSRGGSPAPRVRRRKPFNQEAMIPFEQAGDFVRLAAARFGRDLTPAPTNSEHWRHALYRDDPFIPCVFIPQFVRLDSLVTETTFGVLGFEPFWVGLTLMLPQEYKESRLVVEQLCLEALPGGAS